MQLWVGLGNPGPQYAMHRHNVGFMAADVIANVHDFPAPTKKFQGWIQDGRIGRERVLLLKPGTFMNESGRSVRAAMDFYKLDTPDVTVFYDELDLVPMQVKVERGGGAAGHNGIRSTIAHIGEDFQRIRLGIGHPGHKDRVQGHVLSDFHKVDQQWVADLLAAVADAAPLLAAGEDEKYQTEVMRLAPADKSDIPQGRG